MSKRKQPAKRKLLPYIIGAGLIAGAGIFALIRDEAPQENPAAAVEKSEPKIPQQYETACKLSINDVKNGKISPQYYIDELFECLPDVQQARKKGMLAGFIYNPTNEEIEAMIGQFLSPDERTDDIEPFINEIVKSSKGDIHAYLFPGFMYLFGAKKPVYVGFRDSIFYSESGTGIANDADVESIVKHEIQHVDDIYHGINLGGVELSYETISPDTFRADFFENLLELRAEYKQLSEFFKDVSAEKRKSMISAYRFGNTAGHYNAHWQFLAGYPATEMEERVRNAQFQEFSGILPEDEGNSFFLNVDLFGIHKRPFFRKSL